MLKSLDDLIVHDKNKYLGEGAISRVIEVRSLVDNNLYALKIIDINQLSRGDADNLSIEIKMHSTLNHANIIRYVDCLQIRHKLYVMLEYAGNGSIFYYIHGGGGVREDTAVKFFY